MSDVSQIYLCMTFPVWQYDRTGERSQNQKGFEGKQNQVENL